MIGFGIVLGILVVGFGVVSIVAPDAMWAFQRFTNRLEGQTSERSGTWEAGRVFGGLLCIILGLAMIIVLSQV